MTYLTVWLSCIFGVTAYEFAIRREFGRSYFDSMYWSGFALLLHSAFFS